MLIAGAAATPLKSEQFLSALIVVLAGLAIQVVAHNILPSRRSRRARQELTAAGINADQGERTLILPTPAERIQQALQSLFGKTAGDDQGAGNGIRIAGVPSSHWNVNRIHPMGFTEAIVSLEPAGAQSCRVRWDIRSTGEWRSMATMAGLVVAVSVLRAVGAHSAATAPYVIPLLAVFGVICLCLRAVGQRLTTRTWFEERILTAFRQARSETGNQPLP
jgi:type III secretory pathway component EscS